MKYSLLLILASLLFANKAEAPQPTAQEIAESEERQKQRAKDIARQKRIEKNKRLAAEKNKNT